MASLHDLSAVLHLTLPPAQPEGRGYILDVGAPDRNRLSLFVEGDTLVLSCRDKAGERMRVGCPFTPDAPACVMVELSRQEGGVRVSLTVDDGQASNLTPGAPFRIDVASMKVGASVDGGETGQFHLFKFYWLDRTLDDDERRDIQTAFAEKFAPIAA